jgi:hypothetical protein
MRKLALELFMWRETSEGKISNMRRMDKMMMRKLVERWELTLPLQRRLLGERRAPPPRLAFSSGQTLSDLSSWRFN